MKLVGKAEEAERKAKEKEVVHLTSSKYAQEAEDKSDSADEGGRRRRKKKNAQQDRNAEAVAMDVTNKHYLHLKV